MAAAKSLTIGVGDALCVSGLLQAPPRARACYVLAHGAGAGMTHPFMAAAVAGLAERGVATLRYQFPYMERGSKRPDPPKLAQASVRAAVAAAQAALPETAAHRRRQIVWRPHEPRKRRPPRRCRACAAWAFLGFPLHTAGRPSAERGEHLFDVQVPMLFLQGARDALAALDELQPLCKRLGRRATLKLFADADHSFHVPARSGRKDTEVFAEMLDALADWVGVVIGQAPS